MADEPAGGAVAEAPGAGQEAAGAPSADPKFADLERQLAQEREGRERLEKQLGQLTPLALEQWIAAQPKEKQPEIRQALAVRLAEKQRIDQEAALEAQAKRVLIREAALEHGVPHAELEEIAIHLVDPEAVQKLAKRLAKQRADEQRSAEQAQGARAEPAIAGVRPDGGGGGSGITRQSITAKYRGTGNLQGMYAELREHGFRE